MTHRLAVAESASEARPAGGAVAMAIGVGPGAPTILAGPADADHIRLGLSLPFHGFIEVADVDSAADQHLPPRCVDVVRRGGVVLSLTTATASAIAPAQHFAPAVRAHCPGMSLDQCGLIELCLSEAVANAIIHGNLEVDSLMRTDAAGFRRFQATIDRHLADPRLASRRVDMTFERRGPTGFRLAVSDEGAGFDLAAHRLGLAAPTAKRGRGLPLIEKVADAVVQEDDGRTIVMSFFTGAECGLQGHRERAKMEYRIIEEGDAVTVELNGPLNFAANDAFQDCVAQVVGLHRSRVVVDLSGVSLIDSVGLGLLYVARDDLAEIGATLSLANPRHTVRRLFDLTEADQNFEIMTTKA